MKNNRKEIYSILVFNESENGHSRVSGNPPEVVESVGQIWIPAVAGMTILSAVIF
jgi:hypothetical protein